GGYAADLETWGLVSPGPGHLGAWVSCEAESDSDSVLWRVAVDGSPELNRMETEIDMNDHGLNNTGWVQFTSWAAGDAERPVASGAACTSDELGRLFLDADYGLYLCRQVEGSATPELVLVGDSGNSQSVRHATLATDGDLVAKPVCSAEAGQTAQIFLAPAIASSGPTSPPMAAFRAWAEEESEGWRVRLKVKNTSHSDVADWYSPTDEGESLAPYYGSAMVLTMCVRAAE
ncbi:MAG: shufflon system plasmid conjugative transfer pilus tip adhesin PilV, partial [Desulfovibrionaceae bacterium]|nr:shufflon system plasmid conjugative transfer pilus tip adhesin PilV [Desulfovibrionaceae bacterium]